MASVTRILICLVASLIAPLSGATDEDVQKDIDAGDEALHRWDYADAISYFSHALEKDPLNVYAYAARGFMYARSGDLDRAMADTSRAIQLDPKCARAYCARAIVFDRRDEFDKAIADFSDAIRLEPDNSMNVGMRADLYARQGDFKKAMVEYDRAVELDPKAAVNFCSRGDLRAELGDYTGAVSDYQTSQQLDSRYAASYISCAWLLATCPDAQLRDGALAVEYAKIGLDLNPKREDGWKSYAAALAAVGKFEEAAKWQQRFADFRGLSEIARVQAQGMVALYKSHQPYIAPYPTKR